MRSIAFVTCAPFGPLRADGFLPDDAPALPWLEAHGARVSAVRWDDPAADWAAFDLVVIRTPWDYFRRLDEFLAWLARLEAAGARVHNPVPLVRENLDKRYLVQLAGRGLAVTPTEWIARGSGASLASVLEARGWSEAVVKPSVSAAAFETWRASRGDAAAEARFAALLAGRDVLVQPYLADIAASGEWSLVFFHGAFSHALRKFPTRGDFRVQEVHGGTLAAAEARFASLLAGRDMLVQPYLADIAASGEWSLVFFHGAFSHALRKFPTRGDFRVQEVHGGTLAAAEAPADLVHTAAQVLAAAAGAPLYARVDGVVTDSGFLLMELELIEPELFLRTAPDAPRRFADAIARTLASPAA